MITRPLTPPLVLLHAFPLDSRLFDPIRQPLSASTSASTGLLTPDLRGFGTGPPLPDPPAVPDLDVFAADVVADLDAAGIERAVIGGVSMGGYIAMAILRLHPERVAGLVLADTRCEADDAAALERRAGAADRADRGDMPTGLDAVAPLVAAQTSTQVRDRLAGIAADVPPATIAWAQRAMAARPDSTDVLTRARVPTLVIVGELDTVTPPVAARRMVTLAGDAHLVELPGVGHLSPAEDPAGFAAAVTQWWPTRF